MSKKCLFVNEGLKGGFHYGRINTSGEEESKYHDKPFKNMYSHSIEALEYIAMGYCIESKKPPKKVEPPRPRMSGGFYVILTNVR